MRRLLPLLLLLLGTALFGGGTTAGLQARYAATDLASAERRGRALSVVVWATTIGGVVGPNLVGPAGRLGEQLGIERLAAPSVRWWLPPASVRTHCWSLGHCRWSTPSARRGGTASCEAA